jgi:hypothetical protein
VTWIRLPLRKGATWASEFRAAEGEDRAVFEFTVAGEETVETPAGAFQALRLDGKGEEDGKDGLVSISSWLAPDVGEVKRTVRLAQKGGKEVSRTLELVRFDRKRD